MKAKGKPKAKGKKGGAPKGNKNAVKHGFYAKHYTANEISLLDADATLSATAEIKLLRVYLARLTEQIDFTPNMILDDKGNEQRDRHYLEQLNTAAHLATAISSLIRTEHLRNKEGSIGNTIMEAILSLDPDDLV